MPQTKSKRRLLFLPTIILILTLSILAFLYGETWLRHILLYLSSAVWARSLVSRLPMANQVAKRFVAGESIEDAINATKELNRKGMMVTLDYLGESVTNTEEAMIARNEILYLLECIDENGLNANVSVKLSQLGLKINEQIALENTRMLLERASLYGNKIRIDMEESAVVDTTLKIYRILRDDMGFNNVGIVIQSYLYRSENDVRELIDEGAWIRLCKGAYMEPPDIAYPDKKDTDANYVKLTQMLLGGVARQNGVYLGVATHDEEMIAATIDFVKKHDIDPSKFEFQMLYGIRRDLQDSLLKRGYQIRIYVPYGTAWYPYFIRRLAERPANLWFFITNFIRR